jgi:hypothetical protein
MNKIISVADFFLLSLVLTKLCCGTKQLIGYSITFLNVKTGRAVQIIIKTKTPLLISVVGARAAIARLLLGLNIGHCLDVLVVHPH